ASEQEAKRIQEENARKLAAEEEVQKQREESQRQQAALQQKEEEQRRVQEAEARRVRELELQQAEVQRQEELRKQEALARQRLQELEERRRHEEALARQREFEERRREEEALAQARAKELEARRRAEEEARKLAEALARQKEGEELAARLREEETARKRAAAEAPKQREMDDFLRGGSAVSIERGDRSGEESNLPKTGGSLAARALEQIRQPGAANIDTAEASPSGDTPGSSRRGTVFGSIDTEVGLRAYVEGWRQKIERGGNLNYAQSVKDRARGDPIVSVSIRSDGSVESVVISRSSGRPELDEAVRRIVKLHAPYAAFSPTLARRHDVIVIRRIWSFDDRLRILEEVR
ncbi:MAG: TonB family protein, partial [Paucimonas sp.]|nr:TonB family protein [Paucimonas sp.]